MRNINDLPNDLLVKILSLLPTKNAVATSVLSKQWCYLWKQLDLDYIELCDRCDGRWPIKIFGVRSPHNPLLWRPNTLKFSQEVYEWKFEKRLLALDRYPITPEENPSFASLMLKFKAKTCVECKERIDAHKKVTIFVFNNNVVLSREWAFVWTKLEDKQQMQIEAIASGTTMLSFCLSIN